MTVQRKDIPDVWRDEARKLDGLFAGSMEPKEYEYLLDAGLLRITYEGAAGFLGLGKLRQTL